MNRRDHNLADSKTEVSDRMADMTEQHLSKERGPGFLQRAFASEQECLAAQLRSSDRIVHPGDRGEVNERYFIDVLRHYLPGRYTVDKASIIDSDGAISDSIDVVIFDRHFTPALFDSDKHRYVTAEAVYGVFECKPTIDKAYLEYAADKAASVRKLKQTSVEIHHAGGTYSAKPPLEIIAGILSIEVDWADGFGAAFEVNHKTLTDDRRLDCGLAVSGNSFDIFDGKYALATGRNTLAFFLFRLLGKLQTLGTVPAVDWNAYADQLVKEGD